MQHYQTPRITRTEFQEPDVIRTSTVAISTVQTDFFTANPFADTQQEE